MTQLRVSDAARFLGVSDDTVRRMIQSGSLPSVRDEQGRTVVEGRDLAQVLRDGSPSLPDRSHPRTSARNRFVGLVTAVTADSVMAQVEMQCGPFRVVSLMSSEAVRDLALEPGSIAAAVIKSTNVVVESLE